MLPSQNFILICLEKSNVTNVSSHYKTIITTYDALSSCY